MWATRTTPNSGLADGTCSRPVVAVWLGAGGSGKTWSLTQVLRSLFQMFLPPQALLAVAPAHAAGRLLGKDAITLHKAGDAAFRQKWDKESLALKGGSFTKARQRFEPKEVIALDEIAMVAQKSTTVLPSERPLRANPFST